MIFVYVETNFILEMAFSQVIFVLYRYLPYNLQGNTLLDFAIR
jgi:hypothetical protein